MRMRHLSIGLIALTALMPLSGCTKSYKMTHDLWVPIIESSSCEIGAITDDLPMDVSPEDRPTLEQVEKLRGYLAQELQDKDVFQNVERRAPVSRYIVTGHIMSFKKGSGVLRFFFGGFGSGSAGVTVELSLSDRESGDVLIAGSFTQAVTHWSESGDKMLERVAKDFAKELKNQVEDLKVHPKEG